MFLTAFFGHPDADTAVRATLSDGQVLMGAVRTRTLRLESGVGTLEIPLEDVGEVLPVAGGELADANGFVNVWLRNGSELRGRWADPELEMDIAVGGDDVAVNLPMNDLSRFQLQASARWPTGPVYRLRTSAGDDFLVDPTQTRLALQNKLGSFAPLLSECRSVAPIGAAEGDWRVELTTGTVLIGAMRDQTLTVALPMGPEEISVPLARFVSLQVEDWGGSRAAQLPEGREQGQRVYAEATSAAPAAAPTRAAVRDEGDADGWFDNDALEAAKADPR